MQTLRLSSIDCRDHFSKSNDNVILQSKEIQKTDLCHYMVIEVGGYVFLRKR